MSPTAHHGDLYWVRSQPEYSVRDIVAFRVPNGGVVIHRIVEITPEGYAVKGDNNDQIDPWSPNPEEVLGRARLRIPGGGYVFNVIQQPFVFALFASVVWVIWLSTKRGSAGNEPILNDDSS